MTLVADVGGVNTDLTLFTSLQWELLREHQSGIPIKCRGCGGSMHTREAPTTPDPETGRPRVIRMFVHNPGQGERCRAAGLGESPEHDALKTLVANAGRAVGWEASLEVRHADACQSDVVLTSPAGDVRSVEVQLGTLQPATVRDRHERYGQFVSKTVWFYAGRNQWPIGIPAFRLNAARTHVVDCIYASKQGDGYLEPIPVDQVVSDWLSGRILYYHLPDSDGFYYPEIGNKVPRRTKRPRPVPEKVRRECTRINHVLSWADTLEREGLGPPEQFYVVLREAHRKVKANQYRRISRTLTPHEHRVLCFAGRMHGVMPLEHVWLAELNGGIAVPND